MSDTVSTFSFNPWTLPRPEMREDERDYTDRRHPGVVVRVRFRELNPFLEGQALRLYGEYYNKWVKPRSIGNGKEPSPQLLPTPSPILLNEVILDQMVLLQAMHVPLEGQPKYGLIEWSGFAANMPDAFREMLKVCRELNQEQDSGNVEMPETTSGEQSSSQLSSSDNLTPNGSSTLQDVSNPSLDLFERLRLQRESQSNLSETAQEPSIPGF